MNGETGAGPRRQMTLVAFMQAQNCTNLPSSWRHAAAEPDFLTAEYYQRIARTLEAGKFHIAFFDDRLALPDRYGVVPELQRRGLFRREYSGTTLRENLGLPRASLVAAA